MTDIFKCMVKDRAYDVAYLRYHFEQGLSKRPLSIEDIFVPGLLDT